MLGQHWGNNSQRRGCGGGCPAGIGASQIHGVGDLVETVFEQVPVRVEGHRRRAVTQHLLHDLDVGTGCDRKRRGRMTQLVRVEVWHSNPLGRRPERVPKSRHTQCLATSDAAEHEVLGTLARDVLREVIDQEPRDRHLPALMRLGGAPHHPQALDRGHRLGDDGATLGQIDTAHSQRSHLAEPHTCVGEEQHDEPVHLVGAFVEGPMFADFGGIAAGVRERIDLAMGEVPPLVLDRPWKFDLGSDVAAQAPVLHRHVEHQ